MLRAENRTKPTTRTTPLESVRVQLALELMLGAALPYVFTRLVNLGTDRVTLHGINNSSIAACVAIVLAVTFFRRVTSFPGIRAFRFVLPTYAGVYALVLTTILGFRIDYNRPLLTLSFLIALGTAFLSNLYLLRRKRRRFYVVPFGREEMMVETPNTEWIIMGEPQIPTDPAAIIVADLHFDHDQAWEQMLAHAAVAGHPVYHVKQLRESLTGRVSIEHISENSFGSMLPNLAYRKVKRVVDLVAALVTLPLLSPLLLVVALTIRLDSPGPALFRQQRMGYRGRPFTILKFRTMHVQPVSVQDARDAAMTGDSDPRITKFGGFLRRSRIDELPQILNIVVGDMSWIGPRPEAIPLSKWYEQEIPFYFYRHIVRPGITGWAQVNQGHVSDIDAVSTKLSYDFYYIKNFSAWLDALIALRTANTMLNGFGAR